MRLRLRALMIVLLVAALFVAVNVFLLLKAIEIAKKDIEMERARAKAGGVR
jgi:hypothetical protein